MPIPITAHFAAASFLLPAAAGIWRWKSLEKPRRIFAGFCLYAVVHVAAEFILGRFGIRNHFLINFYWLVEFAVIGHLYARWTANRRTALLFLWSVPLYTLFWIIHTMLLSDLSQFTDLSATVAHLALASFSLIVLQQQFQRTDGLITDAAMFWIGAGVLLYQAGTIIVFSMSNTALQMGITYFDIVWHINWGCTIVANLFFARSFRCNHF